MVAAQKVRDLTTVEAEIATIKEQLLNVKGSETEVYARIVGYYRSVRNWNKGKRDEYDHREQFVFNGSDSNCCHPAESNLIDESLTNTPKNETKINNQATRYEFFARKTCPNCPPVKEYLSKTEFA